MIKRIFLSHVLAAETPVYRANPPVETRPDRQMAHGDSCNTAIFRFHNHSGTHLDAPLHFDSHGRGVDELEAGELVFEHVVLVDVPALPGELIGPDRVGHARSEISDADIVLLRTQFEERRGDKAYVERNPGLAPDLADWLRAAARGLRAIGVDLISISAAEHRDAGRDAHRRFLAPSEGRPVLLIEDMSLVHATPNIARLWVLPLRMRGSDGAPCTIVAEAQT